MSYPIINFSTWSSSNEIKGLIVVLTPLQLTLGHVVECIEDHECLLDDLLNGATLA
jgi:hypothetical protein